MRACALDDTGVVCWGYDNEGSYNQPLLSNPTQISVGHFHNCVIDDTGVVCWADIFRDNHENSNVPQLSNPTLVSTGVSHTCVLDDSGVVCWGSNDFGEINVPVNFYNIGR